MHSVVALEPNFHTNCARHRSCPKLFLEIVYNMMVHWHMGTTCTAITGKRRHLEEL